MLFNRKVYYKDIAPLLETKKLIILVKKLLPDIVFNMASLEGNPFKYPEVQTLLDGITNVERSICLKREYIFKQ